jgi:HprK-related kinase B
MNQVVNFIVMQTIEHYLRRGWLLCHAAGVAHRDRALVIAAGAGGGKSTLALHLMRHRVSYVSNDRVLLRGPAGGARVAGVPKLPRINPGTALHHPNLREILDPVRREELSRMPAAELWTLEEKYDVHLDRVFNDVRFVQEADLHAVVLLGWRLQHESPAQVQRVNLSERPDLVAALAKSVGPMLVVQPGTPAQPNVVPLSPYLDHLRDVPVYEITGGVDFEAATDACLGLLASRQPASRQPDFGRSAGQPATRPPAREG